MTPAILYTAVERFDPTRGERWTAFVEWSHLAQLCEVISLDISLCPSVFTEPTIEDWKHNVHEDFQTHLFRDADYVIAKVGMRKVNVLALIENPSIDDVTAFSDPRFLFRGYDLNEHSGGYSPLVNCGGFDRAFRPVSLSACGLLDDFAEAVQVQRLLRDEYPDITHAQCERFALWQLREG